MDKKDSEKLIQLLKSKWQEQQPCPMCKKGEWSVQDKIFELREFRKEGLNVGSPIMPVIPITCLNCGNTVLINALVSKILES